MIYSFRLGEQCRRTVFLYVLVIKIVDVVKSIIVFTYRVTYLQSRQQAIRKKLNLKKMLRLKPICNEKITIRQTSSPYALFPINLSKVADTCCAIEKRQLAEDRSGVLLHTVRKKWMPGIPSLAG